MTGIYFDRVPKAVIKGHVIMGIMQICVGSLVIVLSVVSSSTMQSYGTVGTGFWAGPFIIAAGVSGLLAGRGACGTVCCVITCLVLSVLASCLGFIALILESIMATMNQAAFNSSSDAARGSSGLALVNYAASVASALLFALETVLALVHAVYACRASCCCVPSAPPAAAAPRPAQQQQLQVTQVVLQQQQQQRPVIYQQHHQVPFLQPQQQYQQPQQQYQQPQQQYQQPQQQYQQQPAYNPNYAPQLPPSYDQAMLQQSPYSGASAPPK